MMPAAGDVADICSSCLLPYNNRERSPKVILKIKNINSTYDVIHNQCNCLQFWPVFSCQLELI